MAEQLDCVPGNEETKSLNSYDFAIASGASNLDCQESQKLPEEFSPLKAFYGILIIISTGGSVCATSQFTTIAYTDYNFTSTALVNWFAGSAFMINYPVIAAIMGCWGEAVLVCGKNGLTIKDATIKMLTLSLIASLSNYAYYYALVYTSSTDVTAIFSSATAFVYVLSVVWLKEPFIITRLIAVLLSMAGVVSIAYSEGFGSFGALGVLLAFVSALFAAIFRVTVKRFVKSPSIPQTAMLVSLVGVYNLLTLWFPVLLLHVTGTEVITANSFPWPFYLIALFHGLYDLLLGIGIAITYPVYASLGPLMAIPMNAIIDVAYRLEIFNTYKILGTVALMISFIILTIPMPMLLAFSAKLRKRFMVRLCNR